MTTTDPIPPITNEGAFAQYVSDLENLERLLVYPSDVPPEGFAKIRESIKQIDEALNASPFGMDSAGNVYRRDSASLTPEILEDIVSVPDVIPIQTEDGFLIHPDSGAVLGHVRDLPERPFTIDDDDSVNWALKLLHSLEGDVAGLQARRDALVAEMDAIIANKAKRIAFWIFRFEMDVKRYARSQLKGKEKTARFPWGHVSFRTTPGSNKIVSEEEAMAYVETFAPELVKTKTERWVGIKEVLAAAVIAEKALGEPQTDLGFMKHTGPDENVTISTGIQIEGKKKR